jgi:ATP-dependent protease ClpP protease subunit
MLDYFWTFAGPLNETSSERFLKQLPYIMQTPVDGMLHLSIQSAGGLIGDGVWLYHLPMR